MVEKKEEEYEDRGDFKLRQDNYVRPYFPPLGSVKPPAPFPEALKDTRTPSNDKEIFETFSKCEVNIPLLQLIKSIPRYAKFLKELCKLKRKQSLKGKKKVQVSERVSAMIQKQLPSKCEDPGMFTIPIEIGKHKFGKAMLDLGASINVLPSTIYDSLALGPLVPTGIVIQLADGSSVHPRGVVEDVLVKVGKLVFPADFFVMDMSDNSEGPVMLGRPFMSTSKTKIDVFGGVMTMEFDGDIIEHSIHDVNSTASVCMLTAIPPPTKEDLDLVLESSSHVVHNFDDVVDVSAIFEEPSADLGNRPTILTPSKKLPVSAEKQVKKKKAKNPPQEPKAKPKKKDGGGQSKKKEKMVWRPTEENGLRFKPFHKWFKDLIIESERPKGPFPRPYG